MPFRDNDEDPYETLERKKEWARDNVSLDARESAGKTVAQADECISSSSKLESPADEYDEYLVDYNEWIEEKCKEVEAQCSSSPEQRTSSSIGQSSVSSSSQSRSEATFSSFSDLTESNSQVAQVDESVKGKAIPIQSFTAYVHQGQSLKRRLSAQTGQKKVRKLGVGLAARPTKLKEERKWQEWESNIESQQDEMRYDPHRQYYSPILDQLCDCEFCK